MNNYIKEYFDSFPKTLTLTKEDKVLLSQNKHPKFSICTKNVVYGRGYPVKLQWNYDSYLGIYSVELMFTDGKTNYSYTVRSSEKPSKENSAWLSLPDEISPLYEQHAQNPEYKNFVVSVPAHITYDNYIIPARSKDHVQMLLDNEILDYIDSYDRESVDYGLNRDILIEEDRDY